MAAALKNVGDSLDQYPANRDAFWNLMESEYVMAYLVGHTHYYSKHLGDKDGLGDVWQIDAGNAGNGSPQTFVNVHVTDGLVTYSTYDNSGGTWHLVESWSAAVPEPATLALLAAGAAVLAARRRPHR
jgi:hypothetical protein